MMSMLSKISTNYACFAIAALIVTGFVLNAIKPHAPVLSSNVGQIALGVTQIISGLIVLALTYIVIRRMWS